MTTSGTLSYNHDAVRVRVKKCIGTQPHDYKKFTVDPQITSFEVLQSIVAKAFDLKSGFSLSYRALDDYGQETFLPLLSDWDLDAAFLNASEPCLTLNIDAKLSDSRTWHQEEIHDDQRSNDIPCQLGDNKPQTRLPGLIMNRMERTFNIFQRAFNMGEEVTASAPPVQRVRPPLTDAEFRKYLDPIGQISDVKNLRSAIYFRGVEPSLRFERKSFG